jgi:hypothetical protein
MRTSMVVSVRRAEDEPRPGATPAANSFYAWQGFMEGARPSGIDAAAQIPADVKAGNL